MSQFIDFHAVPPHLRRLAANDACNEYDNQQRYSLNDKALYDLEQHFVFPLLRGNACFNADAARCRT